MKTIERYIPVFVAGSLTFTVLYKLVRTSEYMRGINRGVTIRTNLEPNPPIYKYVCHNPNPLNVSLNVKPLACVAHRKYSGFSAREIIKTRNKHIQPLAVCQFVPVCSVSTYTTNQYTQVVGFTDTCNRNKRQNVKAPYEKA